MGKCHSSVSTKGLSVLQLEERMARGGEIMDRLSGKVGT
jgi:hypothetical protein